MKNEYLKAEALMEEVESLSMQIAKGYFEKTGKHVEQSEDYKLLVGATLLFLQKQIDDLYKRMKV